jgi:phosphopantetheinyl transferase
MPLFKTIPVTGGLIGVWELTETSADLMKVFSPEEIADPDFQKYTYEKRKVEWLASRLMLKQLIGTDFKISYSETGKPILRHNKYKQLSISHSRNFAAVFVHESSDIGIDIESLTRNYQSIEKRYLSDAELLQVGQNPVLQCLYWCAKEAIFKLVPDQGVEFREQILISPFNPETENCFPAKFISDKQQTEYQLYYIIFSDHGMVWVTS